MDDLFTGKEKKCAIMLPDLERIHVDASPALSEPEDQFDVEQMIHEANTSKSCREI